MTAVTAISPADRVPAGLHEPCVLLKLGEIVLKGRNRQQFERLLQNNIRLAVADLGVGVRLWQRDGVIVVNPAVTAARAPAVGPGTAPLAADPTAQRIVTGMGVVRVCRAVPVAPATEEENDGAARAS